MNIFPRFNFSAHSCLNLFWMIRSNCPFISVGSKDPQVEMIVITEADIWWWGCPPSLVQCYWSSHMYKLMYWLHFPELLWCNRIEASELAEIFIMKVDLQISQIYSPFWICLLPLFLPQYMSNTGLHLIHIEKSCLVSKSQLSTVYRCHDPPAVWAICFIPAMNCKHAALIILLLCPTYPDKYEPFHCYFANFLTSLQRFLLLHPWWQHGVSLLLWKSPHPPNLPCGSKTWCYFSN